MWTAPPTQVESSKDKQALAARVQICVRPRYAGLAGGPVWSSKVGSNTGADQLNAYLLVILSIIERKLATGSRLESIGMPIDSADAEVRKERVAGEARKHVAQIYAPDFEAFGFKMWRIRYHIPFSV